MTTDTTTEAPNQPQPWACPWRICTHTEAQRCRQLQRSGCGGRFGPNVTPERAAEIVAFKSEA